MHHLAQVAQHRCLVPPAAAAAAAAAGGGRGGRGRGGVEWIDILAVTY